MVVLFNYMAILGKGWEVTGMPVVQRCHAEARMEVPVKFDVGVAPR